MRRFSAISLLALLALSLLTPLFGASADASAPACCRRNGAHHCAMGSDSVMGSEGSNSHGPSFRENRKCPLYSGFNLMCASAPVALHRPAPNFSVQLQTVSLLRRQAEVARAIASAREHSKRGPPAVRLFV